MGYYWKHYTKEQVIGDNYWRKAIIEKFGLVESLDMARGSVIIGDDIYELDWSRSEDATSMTNEEVDNYDIADEDYEFMSGYKFEDIKPYIRDCTGETNPYICLKVKDIDDVAGDLITYHGLISALKELEKADINYYSYAISVKED